MMQKSRHVWKRKWPSCWWTVLDFRDLGPVSGTYSWLISTSKKSNMNQTVQRYIYQSLMNIENAPDCSGNTPALNGHWIFHELTQNLRRISAWRSGRRLVRCPLQKTWLWQARKKERVFSILSEIWTNQENKRWLPRQLLNCLRC